MTGDPAASAARMASLMVGMICSAPRTERLPLGSAKSFWTSTTSNAVAGP
jgi:hypothetical protein